MKKPTLKNLNDFWLQAIGIPLVALFLLFLFDDNKTLSGVELIVGWLINCMYTFFIWYANRLVFQLDLVWFPEIEKTIHRIIFQIITSILVTALVLWILETVQFEVFKLIPRNHDCYWTDLKHALLITALIAAIYESRYFFEKWNLTREEVENLRTANLKTQLESLKNQVNPHFLFNSLNTLIAVIDENPEIAKKFTMQLSDVYRYILHSIEHELTSLNDEIIFLNAYTFLLKIRFAENFDVNLNIPESLFQTKIPPLTLQILVENAIKHNIVSAKRPLMVEIYAEENIFLVVKNNLQLKQTPLNSSKVGLLNISERYKLLANKSVKIIETEMHFNVYLPIIF